VSEPGDGVDVRSDVEARMVDVLDGMVTLRSEASRHLLAELVQRRAGARVSLPDYPTARQWFVGLVEVCGRTGAGLMEALVAALAHLEPGSAAARELAGLGRAWASARVQTAEASPDGPGPPAAAGPHHGSSGAGGSGGPPSDVEPLTDAEIRVLAAVFSRRDSAEQLLSMAGLAPGRQPGWQARTAGEFWFEVGRLLAAGAVRDGRARLLAAAYRLLPGDPDLAGLEPPERAVAPGSAPSRGLGAD
jgi:hypothetical protein